MPKERYTIGSIIRYFKAMARERERAQSFMYAKQQYIAPGDYKVYRLGNSVVCKDPVVHKVVLGQGQKHNAFHRRIRFYVKQLVGNLFRIRIASSLVENGGVSRRLYSVY